MTLHYFYFVIFKYMNYLLDNGELMKKKKKKFLQDKYARRRFILLIGIVLFCLLIKSITGIFLSDEIEKQISFLLDNEIINLKNEMFIDANNVIYLSKDDVENIFDHTIYYNDAEKELITTFNKHIALLKVDETFMVVNDSNVELKSPMVEKNKIIYLPISEMGIVYDLEFEYTDSTKTVIADSVSKEKKQTLILKNVNLKEKPTLFSKKIEKLLQGEYAIVVAEDGNYTKIRTTDGNIGFVKTKKISTPEIIRENWIQSEVNVNVLKEASDLSKNYSNVSLDSGKTNVVVPHFFYMDNNTILDKTNNTTEEYTKYMNWVKENDIEVWATISNNIEVSNSLRTYSERNKIINSLYYILVEYQFSGVNINFEKIDDVNSFNRFIIELTPRLKELGLKVAVTYNKNVDKDKLEDIVDIIIE